MTVASTRTRRASSDGSGTDARGSVGRPRALLFDLGGVVIDIDFDRALRAWSPMSTRSFDDLKGAFRFGEEHARHERGEIACADYFAHLASALDLSGPIERIAAGWNAIFVGEIVETTAMIATARRTWPCYAFSNTNATHQVEWTRAFPSVVASFDRVFTSHELGCRKPERRAFERVAAAIGCAPDELLFFDDSMVNVEGARTVGMRAVRVGSPDDVRAALQAIGVAV